MHSTVQTGLFTPNIYNCEHNLFHHPSPNHSRNGQYHLPPHHHHFNHQRHHRDVSVHSSLLGINLINDGDGLNKGDSRKGSKLNLSASNLTHSSSKNLEVNSEMQRKESTVSSSSTNKLSVRNLNQSKISINKSLKSKNFWDCSKPCGVLTLVVAFCLLIVSCLSFAIVLVKNICNYLNLCSNALVTLSAISCLVIGLVLIFIGLVIIIYTKKDFNAKVIRTTARNFDRMVIANNFPSNNDINKNNNIKKTGSVPLLLNATYGNE
ncbi:unnamed protein product [Brachionus calyciflorus]|uniref:Uncharacterized protein n=1 Tax=Brachionus calyciflorus TaxID=104777 RepID=A0A814BYC0_9BILA|nr:unnamed protein product [Brachionus calyciflorus]